MKKFRDFIDRHVVPVSVGTLFISGFLSYSNFFGNGFHFDDFPFIVNNLAICNPLDFGRIFDFFPTRFIGFWTLSLNRYFGGSNPFGYHLVTLFIHIFNAMWVWLLAKLVLNKWGDKEHHWEKWLPLAGALFFLLHPLQTQALNYIAKRPLALCSFFCLGSLDFYLLSRTNATFGRFGKRHFFILSLVFFLFAVFTKEISASLPLVIMLFEIFLFNEKFQTALKKSLPYFFTVFIIPIMLFVTKPPDYDAIQRLSIFSKISDYFLFQIKAHAIYLKLLLLPIGLNIDHDIDGFGGTFFMGFIVFLSVLIFLNFALSKKSKLSFFILTYISLMVMESGFLPLNDEIFEHRLYLPMFLFSLFLVLALQKLKPKTALIVSAILLFSYSVFTFRRNYVWKNEITLWSDSIKKSPQKYRPYFYRGTAYITAGKYDMALSDLDASMEKMNVSGDRYEIKNFVLNNRAIAYNGLRRKSKAVKTTR
jgi:protein O-mannosyl-transferase